MTRNDALRPVYPCHGEGSDDDTYRRHAAHLFGKRRWHEVLPDTVDREIIAMYLGILSMRRIRGKPEVALEYSRVLTTSEIAMNLVNRYGVTSQDADDQITDAYVRFIDSMPMPKI